jgi:protein-L-isoaspartate(D-aspartate) O-methyltransferase
MVMNDYASARLHMVEGQLRTNKVTDMAILQAMLDVPRERFVPEQLKGSAYVDEDIPLGDGRFLMEPMVFARLLQFAAIEPRHVVLEVGTGTGYGAAVLGRIAASVVALESDRRFVQRAQALLGELGTRNVSVIEGPLAAGYPKRAPYNAIIFSGAVAAVPPAITDQLADGGRLLAVVRPATQFGQAVLMVRKHGVVSQRVIFDAATPVLPDFAPQPSFVF